MNDVLPNREDPTYRGGADFTCAYTREQMAALGSDAQELLDSADTALWVLAALRDGNTWGAGHGRSAHEATEGDWVIAISDLSRLAERVDALLAHAMVAHAATAGGSVARLGVAMGVAKSTAQSRLDVARAQVGRGGPLSGWATVTPSET